MTSRKGLEVLIWASRALLVVGARKQFTELGDRLPDQCGISGTGQGQQTRFCS